jgi:hypothetical protein
VEEEIFIDRWSYKDLFGCITSVLTYAFFMIGTAGILLNKLEGWLTLILAFTFYYITFRIFNPIINRQSEIFMVKENTFKNYIEENQRWDIE